MILWCTGVARATSQIGNAYAQLGIEYRKNEDHAPMWNIDLSSLKTTRGGFFLSVRTGAWKKVTLLTQLFEHALMAEFYNQVKAKLKVYIIDLRYQG